MRTVINRMRLALALVAYYGVANRFPTQPVPGWRTGYRVRRMLMSVIAERCGADVVVKQGAYVGRGRGLVVGDRAQLGENSRIGPMVTLGDDVIMGPDVVLMTTAHEFDRRDVPINQQGGRDIQPIVIGDDVWIGTRVVIMPGVRVGRGAVLGANAVVTRDVAPYAIVGGSPARNIGTRGEG